MKKLQHFKNIIISLLIIYVWILYNFFDYYDSLKYSLSKLTLYYNFIIGVFFGIGIGLVLIISRIALIKRNKLKLRLKNNFFYTFLGLFNLNLFIVWFVSIFMRIIDLDIGFTFLILIIFFISVFILIDIYLLKSVAENKMLEHENN